MQVQVQVSSCTLQVGTGTILAAIAWHVLMQPSMPPGGHLFVSPGH